MGLKAYPPPPEWRVYQQRITNMIGEALRGGICPEKGPQESAQWIASFAEHLITDLDDASRRLADNDNRRLRR